jgi:NAD(P)H-hydrate epimerase
MISLFTNSQVREIDTFAINELGIPGSILMENASREIFLIAKEKILSLKKRPAALGFVCGRGNNGGDGYAAARHFANDGFNVIVIQLGKEEEMSHDCSLNYNILQNISEYNPAVKTIEYKTVQDLNELKKCQVIVDAILGSGSRGDLKPPLNTVVKFLNKLPGYKIALDIPTGLDSDKAWGELIFNADLTITLAEFKRGLFFGVGYTNCGEIIKGNIGIDNDYFSRLDTSDFLIEPDDAFEFLPRKRKDINKYTSGKVLTIAGSGDYPGAAVMTSRAAFKIGAGASVLAFPKSARKLIAKDITEVVINSYSAGNEEYLTVKDIPQINKRIQWADTVALGPGVGRNKETVRAVLQIIKQRKAEKLIIDADALFPLYKKIYKNYNLAGFVLTPHHGEFASLLGISTDELKKDLSGYGSDFSKATKSFLVLKGAPTIIFSPDGTMYINSAGNPGLAKFGTGDVLTGVLAGILSQQRDTLKSLIAGVYLHSLTGDLLSRNYTNYGYTASDLIDHLPFTIKFLRDSFV